MTAIKEPKFIGRREYTFFNLNFDELNAFIKETQSYVFNQSIPKDYTIHVYKERIVCCGLFDKGMSIEIEGPERTGIKDLDLMTYSKVIDICERKHVEYHDSELLEIL